LQENDEPFAVIDCGPVGALPKEIKKPGIYAVFSHPAVPLAQLGAVLDETAGFFSIEPPLPGVYRWYGSRVLSFEPSAESLPQQRYTITVSENLKSLGGKPLTGNRSFSFETERLSVLSWQIGREGWINPSSVHPEDARYITVLFSYPVDLQEIAKYIIVRGGGKIRDFSLSRPAQPDISRGVSPDQYVQITLAEPPPVDTDITAEVQIGAKSQPGWLGSLKDARYSFHTLRPFQFRDFSVRTYASPQTLEGDSIPIALDFNYQVEKEGAESYFSIAGFPPLKPNNVKVYGDRVILNELPLEYEHSYTVRISRDLKDILGRTLSSADSADFSDQYIEKKIAVGSANSYVYIRDWGPRMLEAGYPQYLWETQNPARVSRGIAAAENPYARSFDPESRKNRQSRGIKNITLWKTSRRTWDLPAKARSR
jgi:hypothetical protein